MTTYTFIMLPDGKLPVGMRETLARVFPTYAGKKLRLNIVEAKDKRSLDQNAYYWAAIVPHVRQVRFDMGDPVTLEQCHEDLLAEFAPMVWRSKLTGKSYQRPLRSKEMNVEQMASYITAITAAMANFGNPIPTIDYQDAGRADLPSDVPPAAEGASTRKDEGANAQNEHRSPCASSYCNPSAQIITQNQQAASSAIRSDDEPPAMLKRANQ